MTLRRLTLAVAAALVGWVIGSSAGSARVALVVGAQLGGPPDTS